MRPHKKSVIDREGATDVEQVPAKPAPIADVPLDVHENQPPYRFVPRPGIGNLDLMEIVLTLMFQAIGGTVAGKAPFRSIVMRPDLYETLSPEAQRFMIQQKEPPANG